MFSIVFGLGAVFFDPKQRQRFKINTSVLFTLASHVLELK